uniref:Putative secreted protein n=1 Tax=Ixodes ricinus TaxID=34613 RepID=A0A147BF80_IXORI
MLRATSLFIMLVIAMAFQAQQPLDSGLAHRTCCRNQTCAHNETGMAYTSVLPTRNYSALETSSMITPERREMNSSRPRTARRRGNRPKLHHRYPL